jgi:hypothetical protein
MPISATAWRTSSTLNGLITAVINFTRLSPLAPLNRAAAATACAYYDSDNAASMPGAACRQINGLRASRSGGCTGSVLEAISVRYSSAINIKGEVFHEFPEFQQFG